MKICPECGRYLSSYIEYFFGCVRTIYCCDCGYSNKSESITATDRTIIDENNKVIITDHT